MKETAAAVNTQPAIASDLEESSKKLLDGKKNLPKATDSHRRGFPPAHRSATVASRADGLLHQRESLHGTGCGAHAIYRYLGGGQLTHCQFILGLRGSLYVELRDLAKRGLPVRLNIDKEDMSNYSQDLQV